MSGSVGDLARIAATLLVASTEEHRVNGLSAPDAAVPALALVVVEDRHLDRLQHARRR
jgi:hypothetical protein